MIYTSLLNWTLFYSVDIIIYLKKYEIIRKIYHNQSQISELNF